MPDLSGGGGRYFEVNDLPMQMYRQPQICAQLVPGGLDRSHSQQAYRQYRVPEGFYLMRIMWRKDSLRNQIKTEVQDQRTNMLTDEGKY